MTNRIIVDTEQLERQTELEGISIVPLRQGPVPNVSVERNPLLREEGVAAP